MKKKILVLMLGFLLIAVNLYAAGGDVIEGDAETGSAASADTSTSAKTSSAQAETPLTSDTTTAPESSSVSTLSAEGSTTDTSLSSWALKPLQISPAGNSGAAATNIPIEVPPGRKDIAPNLSLNYSSNSGNGWLGVGWGLDMGAIQRATKRGVDYTANDYVVMVNGSTSELVPRGDWGTNYYGAKIEGAFSKYQKISDTGGWIVTTKDGTKYYYGTKVDGTSRQDNSYGVFKWCLDRVEDINGNYMTVSYTKDQGEIYLDRIDYTGNTAGLNPTNYVKFYLESRTDVPPMYISNSEVRTAYRLKTIDVIANGQRVRVYALSYSTSSGASMSILSNMQQFGQDAVLDANGTVTGGTALPGMSMDWQVGGSGFSTDPDIGSYSSGMTWQRGGNHWGDVNGDGRADFVYLQDGTSNWRVMLSNGTSLGPDTVWGSNTQGIKWDTGDFPRLVDVNADGKADLVYFQDDGTVGTWRVLLSTGSAFATDSVWGTTTYGVSSYGGSHQNFLNDVDGDGKPDIVYLQDGTATWRAAVSSQGGNNTLGPDSVFGTQSYGTVSTGGYHAHYWADVNGDGKADLVYQQDGTSNWRVMLSNGTSLGLDTVWGSNTQGIKWDTGDGPRLVDVNADGKADLVYFQDDGTVGTWRVLLSTGSAFATDSVWGTTTYGVSSYGGSHQNFLNDVDGDRKPDIVYLQDGTATWRAAVSSQGGNNTLGPDSVFGTQSYGTVSTGGYHAHYWADVNGDSKADLAYLRDGTTTFKAGFSPEPAPDILSTISNGLGATTTITYEPSSAYDNCIDIDGKNVCLPFIVQTVSSISVNDGNGNSSTTNYTYSGGLYDYEDREFRGFQYVKATDPINTTTETWFHQDDIFKGLPYEQITKDSSGNIYTRTYNTYQSTSPYTGVNFPYLSLKDDYVYDGTTTPKQARTESWYDNYGNITRKYLHGDVSITGDERDENTDYNPYDTVNWLVSLPKWTYVIGSSGGAPKAQAWFSYDTKGNLLTKTAWLNGGTNPITTYTYDSYGNVWTITDPKNNPPTTITYDTIAYTYPTTIQNPLGHTIQKTYDYRYGKVLTETDPNNNTTTYAYDVFGRIQKVTNPNDTTSTYGTMSYYYLDFGAVGSQRVLTVATEQSGTANYIWKETYFDGLGRTITTRQEGPDSKVIAQQTFYDNRGQVSYTSLPYFEGIETERWTYFEYDPIGRVKKVTNPDGTYAAKSYMKGRTTLIDANGHQKIEEKDVYGRLIKVEEYTGTDPSFTLYAATQYEYDVLGNLTKVIDANNNQTTINYDTLSRKTSMTDPDMGYWVYGYDANANLTSQIDAKNKIITFTYDALNRITKKDYPAGTADTLYTYDETTSTNSKGRLTKVVDVSSTEKFYYDKLGRITKTIKTVSGVNRTIETTYDALGRTTSIKYPDNEIVNYTYDTGGNIYQVTGYVTSYSNYNALGQAGNITYANGVSTTYQYRSDNNRLYSITTNSPTAGGLQNISYSYDNNGNITGITDSARSQIFTYDDLNRLTQATSTSYGTLTYSYNQIGNMTYNSQVGNYTYPTNGIRPHAVTQAGANTYIYDANGNMTSGAGRTIAYNYDNMPTSITKSGVTTTLVYDYAGQRIKKTASSVTTVYIGKLYECTSSVCTKYVFGGSQRIASKKQGVVYYYHTDHLGSSSIITDSAGNKAEEIYYYPYGGTRIDSGSISVKHKYTSQELDGETGLYYYGARYYDPILGRFISADTIVPEPFNPQSLNRYSYVLNNPIIYIDPSGYGPIVWGGINGGGGSSSGNSITFQNYSYNSSYYYPGYYNYNYNQFRYDPFSESRNSFWGYYGNNSSHSGKNGNVVNPAAGQSGNNFGVGINLPVTVTGGDSFSGNNFNFSPEFAKNIDILHRTIYGEMRSTPEARVYGGWVMKNRANMWFGGDYERAKYGRKGNISGGFHAWDPKGPNYPLMKNPPLHIPAERRAWEESFQAALTVYFSPIDPTGGATRMYYVSPPLKGPKDVSSSFVTVDTRRGWWIFYK